MSVVDVDSLGIGSVIRHVSGGGNRWVTIFVAVRGWEGNHLQWVVVAADFPGADAVGDALSDDGVTVSSSYIHEHVIHGGNGTVEVIPMTEVRR